METQWRMLHSLWLVSMLVVVIAVINSPSSEATIGDGNGLSDLLGLNQDKVDVNPIPEVDKNLLDKDDALLALKHKTDPPTIITFGTTPPTPRTTSPYAPYTRYVPPRFTQC